MLTASLLACIGYSVFSTDINQYVVDSLNQCKSQIVVSDLVEFVISPIKVSNLIESSLL